MYDDMLSAAETAFHKTASVKKVAFEPALGTFVLSFVTLMAAKWLGNRGKQQAQNLAAKAEEALAQKGVNDLATLDKYAQENSKNRWQAVVGLVGREVALAAALTVGVSVQGMLQKMNQTVNNAPAPAAQSQPVQPQAPAAQAPAQQQYDDVKDPFYEADQAKKQEQQREKQQMELLREQDKQQPQRQQNVV